MQRHYFIAKDLAQLQQLQRQLLDQGFQPPQMHVLSQDDASLQRYQLPEVEAVLRKNVVYGTEVGALIGLFVAAAVLALTYLSGVTASVGWLPFIFLAIVLLGFCTWEGGLFGIQEPHRQFKRFHNALKRGKHVFFIDIQPQQLALLQQQLSQFPDLRPAGKGEASPSWVIQGQKKWQDFIDVMP